MAFSEYYRNAILNWLRGTTFPAVPANVYISLHTADPGTTGASEHPASGSYARVAVATAVGSWDAPSGGHTQNTAAITFPTCTADWTAVTHWGMWDTSPGGNFIRGGALTTPRTVTTGATASFAIGVADITLA